MYDAVYNDPPFLEAPRVLVINAPKVVLLQRSLNSDDEKGRENKAKIS